MKKHRIVQSSPILSRSRDVPMDFADATLVVLAEETGIDEILTLDLKGFQTYRILGKKPFTILPHR